MTKFLNIVMFEPEIPQNAGNVARLCACINAKLIFIGRLGFSLSNKYLKRSGLDYWDKVEIEHFVDFDEFETKYPASGNDYYLFTTKTKMLYTDISYETGRNVFLIYGPESRGLSEDLLLEYKENLVTIPMFEGNRSLNLSNSIAIGAYEVVRQVGLKGNSND